VDRQQNPSPVRGIAKQAEAARDGRAKIIHAEAEFQASQTLVNAATIQSTIPVCRAFRPPCSCATCKR
jgi:regulator of protease activity HflC (stomatin/prohibitin superfamily)